METKLYTLVCIAFVLVIVAPPTTFGVNLNDFANRVLSSGGNQNQINQATSQLLTGLSNQLRGCKSIDQDCRSGSDCCSGDCTFRKCRGSGAQCANIGQTCTWDRECCSGDCGFRKCRGGAGQCAWAGQACTFSSECCSNNCRFRKCT